MKTFFWRMILAVSAALLLAVGAVAEADGGWEAGSPYNSYFDFHKLVTVKGKVVGIDRNAIPLPGMTPGFSVVLRTDTGDVNVQVGPSWFTEYYRRKWNVQLGDEAEVTGSLVTIEGKPVLMATRGKKGNLAMVVRSKLGAPVWDIQVEDF